MKILVPVLFAIIVAFHLGCALTGRPLFRATALGTALEYARGPLDVLRPVIVGFTATGTPSALEFPLWQAATGLLFKLAGSTWYGFGNVVSLLFFATCLWPFLQLARQYLDERAAWWALAFFLAQPLIVLMAGMSSADGVALAATVWFLFSADRMIRSSALKWWLPTAVFGALSSVLKLPFFMAAGLASVFLLAAQDWRQWRSWALLATSGLAAAAVFALWTHHANSLAAEAEYPYAELRLSRSPFLVYWWFGDLHYRLRPGPWIKGGWRFLHATLGTLAFVALLLPPLLQTGNRLAKLWLAGAAITTLIFTHVVLEHWHYYLMCCPAVAMLCGATLARLEPIFAQQLTRPWLRTSIAGLALVFSTIDGLIAMKIGLDLDPFAKEASAVIREHTRPEDKLIVYGEGNWGGEVLFRSGRKGLSVIDLKASPGSASPKGLLDLLENEEDLKRLRSLGYTKLVLLSESPARFAAVASNPGSNRRRLLYPDKITEKVDNWPVVFQSEGVLIKQIEAN